MTEFETGAIELSVRNANTGRKLTANVYNVTFDDGTTRVLSMGQLIAALCLAKATEKEDEVIAVMQKMAAETTNIEALSDIEAKFVELGSNAQIANVTGTWTIVPTDWTTELTTSSVQLVFQYLGVSGYNNSDPDSVISAMEAKLDEMNTQSQEQLITLQSETNKRDQRYEMTTNVLKSLYTIMSGIVNNV